MKGPHGTAASSQREPAPILLAGLSAILLAALQFAPLATLHVTRHAPGHASSTTLALRLWSLGEPAQHVSDTATAEGLVLVGALLVAVGALAALVATGAALGRAWLTTGGILSGAAVTVLCGALTYTWGALAYGDAHDALVGGARFDGTASPGLGLFALFGVFAFAATGALAAFGAASPATRAAKAHMPKGRRIPELAPRDAPMVVTRTPLTQRAGRPTNLDGRRIVARRRRD